MWAKKFSSFLIILFVFFFIPFSLAQDTGLDANKADLEKKINEYQQKLTELRQQKNTLTSQIQYMNTQIALTELKIEQTKEKIKTTEDEIEKLGERIGGLDQSIDYLTKLLVGRLVATYKNRDFGILQILFASDNASSLVSRYQYLKSTQEENQRLLVKAQATKINLEEQKQLREEKITELDQLKKQLDQQIGDLNNQKAAKEKLLSETQNSEVVYQRLLAEAQAQLASFSRFVQSQGGASLLGNQTVCDSWGCYYNQRDSQWGNFVVNNSYDCDGACSIAKIGCLITSIAMYTSHLGRNDILPSDIAANPNNFWLTTAYLKKGTISAKGVNITRTTISSYLYPDLLNTGPVIVGVRYGPFGTHFVLVKEYKEGKYIMNDPYIPSGKDLVFTDHYSLDSVFEVDRVTLQ